MIIRLATSTDLAALNDIYAAARRYMAQSGNPSQWGTTKPTAEEIARTVEQGVCYVGCMDAEECQSEGEGARPCCAFTLYDVDDPTYQHIYEGAWPNSEAYATIHRVASDGRAHGVFGSIVAFATQYARERGMRNIRIDTHEDNRTMQHLVTKAGFAWCGIIHLANGDPRLAYQLTLS